MHPRLLLLLWLPAACTASPGGGLVLDERAAVADRSFELAGRGSFEGRYVRRIADKFDGTSEIYDLLVDGTRSVRLAIPEDFDRSRLVRGARLRVSGTMLAEDVLEVADVSVEAPAPVPAIDPEKRPARRIAWIQVYWDGKSGISKEDAKVRLFTGDESTNAYYQQISFGEDRLAGDVFGWFQIPNPQGNPDNIASAAQQALADYGVALWQYEQFMYYFPFDASFGWAGLANLGDPDFPAQDSWYNGSAGCTVLAQELAHNYGLVHSNSYACLDESDQWAPYSENCQESEYGDPFDPMGSGCGHMNVVQKGAMGWLEGCNSVTAPGSATFNLVPMELPCNGIQALRIPIEGTPNYYYLEYRRPLGFDSGFDGVLVHVARNYGSTNPKILDMFDGPGWYLQPGQTYDDHQGRVSFTVVETTPTHAVIDVVFPNAGTSPPSCMDGSEPPMEAGNYGSLECASEPVGPDDVPPTVEITYPIDGDVLPPGTDFTVTTEVWDDRGVTDAQLYVNGEAFYMDIEAPFEWEATNIPEGTYEFGVVVRDGVHWVPSKPVTIRVGTVEGTTSGGGSTGGGSGTAGEATAGGTGGGTATGETDGAPGADATSDDGCSCSSGAAPGPVGLAGLAGLLWIVRPSRRRRR